MILSMVLALWQLEVGFHLHQQIWWKMGSSQPDKSQTWKDRFGGTRYQQGSRKGVILPWSSELQDCVLPCRLLLRNFLWVSHPTFILFLHHTYFFNWRRNSFVLLVLNRRLQPIQLQGTHQTCRDWRGWRKDFIPLCCISLCSQDRKQVQYQKLSSAIMFLGRIAAWTWLMVGLNYLGGPFQPKWFYDS